MNNQLIKFHLKVLGLQLACLIVAISFVSKTYAGTISVTMPNRLPPNSKLTKCQTFLLPAFRIDASIWKTNSSNEYESDKESKVSGEELSEQIKDKIISSWHKERGYTKVQARFLDRLDDKLDPSRTSYFSYEDNKGHFNGIRVFDGSTTPLFYGYPWADISKTTRGLPFEADLRKQGYAFPERVLENKTGKPSYVLSLGLLNVDRHYSKGYDALLRYISQFIVDRNYNGFNYRSKLDLSFLRNTELNIYIVCRESHIKIYEKYGFEEVLYENSIDPVETSDGLYLMKISGEQLVKRYYLSAGEPPVRNTTDEWDYTTEKKNQQDYAAYFNGLKKQSYDMTNEKIRIQETFKLSVIHLMLGKTPSPFENNPMGNLLDSFGLKDNIEAQIKGVQYKNFFEKLYIHMYSAYSSMTKEQAKQLNIGEQHLKLYEILVIIQNIDAAHELYKASLKSGSAKPLWTQEELDKISRKFPQVVMDLGEF